MSTEQIQIDPDMLQGLRNVVLLAAFACEARRVLTELEAASRLSPERDATHSRVIDGRQEWTTHDDTTADALRFVAAQLDTWGDSI